MGFINKILRKKLPNGITDTPKKYSPESVTLIEQIAPGTISSASLKHNIFKEDISQYSILPRYYYIKGTLFDIDSPESVIQIPICETQFSINGEFWGIDGILREHVNRYYSKIPEALKSSCYQKIEQFKESIYQTESPTERQARIKQALEKEKKIKELQKISAADMNIYGISKYKFDNIFCDNNMAIMLVSAENKRQALNDISYMNVFLKTALKLSNIRLNYYIPIDEIDFSVIKKSVGPDNYTEYHTYFECLPYTKTGKPSKFPLVLHYATKNNDTTESQHKYSGKIYFFQNGSIGKACLVCWLKAEMCVVNLAIINGDLNIKSIETSHGGNKVTVFKQ